MTIHLPDDAQLRAAVRQRLLTSGHAAFAELQVEVRQGAVTLRGSVKSFYARQVALAYARTVEGVRYVNDTLSVDLPHAG